MCTHSVCTIYNQCQQSQRDQAAQEEQAEPDQWETKTTSAHHAAATVKSINLTSAHHGTRLKLPISLKIAGFNSAASKTMQQESRSNQQADDDQHQEDPKDPFPN